MDRPLPGPIGILLTALSQLRRHALAALGIAALGTALSGAVPWIQMRLELPDTPATEAALTFAAMIPLQLYALPRFLACLDADAINSRENTWEQWKANFERRWVKSCAALLLFSFALWIGLPLIIPPIVLALLFGWFPYRVLLRGDTLTQALVNSRAIALQTWPRVLRTGLGLFALMLIPITLLLGLLMVAPSEPSLWQRATHPALWAARLFSATLGLILQTAFLAIYWSVEGALEPPAPEA